MTSARRKVNRSSKLSDTQKVSFECKHYSLLTVLKDICEPLVLAAGLYMLYTA